MRTHPLLALLVAAAAITTVTVFGQSAVTPPVPAKKPRHASVAQNVHAAASSAVPAWLVASSPTTPTSVALASAAGLRPAAPRR